MIISRFKELLMNKIVIIFLLTFMSIYLSADNYSGVVLISVGGGIYGHSILEANPGLDYFFGSDFIHSLKTTDLLIGGKYQIVFSELDYKSNKLFFTLYMHSVYGYLLKDLDIQIPPLILPNIELGLDLDRNYDLDYIIGLYWIGFIITPSINYSILKEQLDIGLMLSIPIYVPR